MPRYQQTEDLARYGQAGLPGVSKDIPNLTVTGVVQSPNITAALNRVSDFAFRSIEPAVERQAAQYAFDNPVTIEQLKKGAESGITAEDFIPVGGTKARDTIRKLYGAQAQVELHSDLVSKHTDITRRIDSGEIRDIESLNNELRAPIDGAVRSLASLDPEAAVRLHASASASANSAYKHGVLKFAQDAANLASMKGDRLAEDQLVGERSHMISEFRDQSPRDVLALYNARIDVNQVALYRSAAAAGDTKGAMALVAEHKKDIRQVLLESFAMDASSADHSLNMRKITSGDFKHMNPLWNTLTSDEKNKVASMVANKVSSNVTATKLQRETDNLTNERAVRLLLINNDRSPAARAIINESYLNGGLTKQQLEDYNSPPSQKPTESQERLYITIAQSAAVNRYINPKDEARLTKDQRISLMKLKFDTDTKSAQKFLDLSAGDPGGLAILKESTAQRKIVINQYFTEAVGQINTDGSPKYPLVLDAARAAVTNWQNSSERIAAKEAIKNITSTFSKIAEDFNPAKHDIDAYIKMKGVDDTAAIRLRGLYKRYKEARDKIGPE
jgi:hypothetical protein